MSELTSQITASILTMRPHPDQATNNPGCWAIHFHVTHAGQSRTFWRWHTTRRFSKNGAYLRPDNQPPKTDEILKSFWDDTFSNLHGFDFGRAECTEDEIDGGEDGKTRGEREHESDPFTAGPPFGIT